MLDNLRRQRADWQVVDRPAGDGDRATVDFVGTIDGVAFEGGTGKDVQVVCGEGQMLPDFETGLSGIKADENRVFAVQFPDDYHATELAGKKAQFDTTCSTVEEQVLPEIDDEFCAAYGVEEGGMDKLRAEIAENMEKELQQRIQDVLKKEVLNELLAANPVDLPSALVDEEIHNLQHEAMERMGVKDHDQAPPKDVFSESARRRVSLGLLINEVVREQNLEADAALVTKKIEQLAASHGEPEQVIKAYRSNPRMMNQIEMIVLEQQVIDRLLEQVKLVDEKKTFSEMMSIND